MTGTAQSPSLTEQVDERSLSELRAGTLPPNARPIQDELAAYGVSRQPVSQAPMPPPERRFVPDASKRGAVVSARGADVLRNVDEIREVPDGLAAERHPARTRENGGHADRRGQAHIRG